MTYDEILIYIYENCVQFSILSCLNSKRMSLLKSKKDSWEIIQGLMILLKASHQ